MNLPSISIAVLLWAGAAVLVAGLVFRVIQYARIPVPLKIPTTPAPLSRIGVIGRLAREGFLFESLFKASRPTWLFGWVFHAALVLVLIGHLRFFTNWSWPHLFVHQVPGRHAALAMTLGLAGLWLRRLLVDRIRYISSPSDHLMLALLLAIAATGIAMRRLNPVDLGAVRQFVASLWGANSSSLPADAVLYAHLALAALLLLVFPFSKLLHAPGVFFSPTRNQADNARERRHVNPWGSDKK